MKQIIFVLLALCFCYYSYAQAEQNKFISGIVKDSNSGEPLIGASVYCVNNHRGCSTDIHGLFKLKVNKIESTEIQISYVGYKPTNLTLAKNSNFPIEVILEPGIDLEEINVKATKTFERQAEICTMEMPVKLLKSLPMLGEFDALKAIQLLPGVQSGSEGRNGLYVRGGSPDQNLFQIDGTPVYYVNHLGGFVSVFHPDILKNLKVYKGAFPARYGGRLSSIVDLRMKEGNKREHHGSYGIGLISGDFSMEGPIWKDKTSYNVAVRRVWLDLLVRPMIKATVKDYTQGYNFYDFYGKISHQHNANNRFFLSLYSGDDRLSSDYNIKRKNIKGATDFVWGNNLATLRWNHSFSSQLNSDFTLFYTRYRYSNKQEYKGEEAIGDNTYYTGVRDLGLKADFNYHLSNSYKLHYGAGVSGSWFKPGQISQYSTSEKSEKTVEVGKQNKSESLNLYVYLENEWNISDKLLVNIGARITDYCYKNKNYFSIEPRAMAALNMNKAGVLKASFSKMVQPVHLLSYSSSMFPTDIWVPSSSTVAPGKSMQYSLAYEKNILNDQYEIKIEAYHKTLSSLIEVKGGTSLVSSKSWDENVEHNGKGTSKGFELLCKKNKGKTTGWISYTYAKTDRQFKAINQGKKYPFKYDRRHQFSIVASQAISKKVDFSASWIFGTGYPVTIHNGVYRSINQECWRINSPFQNNYHLTGTTYNYPAKNWLRLSNYHRLDLGINFHKQKGDKIRTWTIGVYNAYCRQNAIYYNFERRNGKINSPIVSYQKSGFPIIPTVKYSIKF